MANGILQIIFNFHILYFLLGAVAGIILLGLKWILPLMKLYNSPEPSDCCPVERPSEMKVWNKRVDAVLASFFLGQKFQILLKLLPFMISD